MNSVVVICIWQAGTFLKEVCNCGIHFINTIFNICATAIFVPFINQIAMIARKVIPETETEKDEHYHLPAILPHSRISADLYSYQIQSEISKMSAKVMEMFDSVCNSFMNPKNADDENERVRFLENYIDEMNAAITDFLQKCARLPNANRDDRKHFSDLLHITDTLENLSDETCSLMHTVKKYVSGEAIEQKIDETKKELKRASHKRLEAGADVKEELQYIDIVCKVERAGDCVYTMLQSV